MKTRNHARKISAAILLMALGSSSIAFGSGRVTTPNPNAAAPTGTAATAHSSAAQAAQLNAAIEGLRSRNLLTFAQGELMTDLQAILASTDPKDAALRTQIMQYAVRDSDAGDAESNARQLAGLVAMRGADLNFVAPATVSDEKTIAKETCAVVFGKVTEKIETFPKTVDGRPNETRVNAEKFLEIVIQKRSLASRPSPEDAILQAKSEFEREMNRNRQANTPPYSLSLKDLNGLCGRG